MRVSVTVLFDALAVIVFVAIGRSSHHEASSVSGFLHTLWPFAAGLLLGVMLSRRYRAGMLAGAVTWLSTLVVGMLLRVISGQGIAASFVVVAAAFLALTFLGWRAVAALALRRSEPARP